MQSKISFRSVLASAPTFKEAYAAHGYRAPGFDTLRLIAASAVVLHHAGALQHDIVRDDVIYAFSGQYTHLGLLAVSVFFALSGFLVTPGLLKSGSVLYYLSRRFMRIMPLLTTVVLITMFVVGPLLTSLPVAQYFAEPETWNYLRNITTLLSLTLPGVTSYDGGSAINGPLWSLHFEWLCYGMLAAATLAGMLRHRWLFLTLYVAAIVALVGIFGLSPDAGQNAWAYLLLTLFSYFGSGVLIFLFRDAVRWSALLMVAALIALALSLWAGAGALFAPLLVTYLVVGCGLMRFPWGGILAKVDLSYGVYLTHSVILTLLVHYTGMQSWLGLFAASLLLSMLVAWVSWTMVERPALRHKHWPADMLRRVLGNAKTNGGTA
ncbi:acyltransferase family protein [Aurantiacibacter sediminis]|uniref:Acyltransferase n=1 Tax=Aurantiacibacter sediminis TaxID=2793064 RepID=A0ABS0MZV8_9SPHN|nr:acyltransferase [Aurantiacibacter sediminis]MBH5321248.1 acyltransferase [Aurantiacibacter sediminis]